jgi:hypothetical protein
MLHRSQVGHVHMLQVVPDGVVTHGFRKPHSPP